MASFIYDEEKKRANCYINNYDDLSKFEEVLASAKTGELLEINVDVRGYDESLLKKVEEFSKNATKKYSNVDILIPSSGLNLKMSDMEKFIDLESSCEKENVGVYFQEDLEKYTLDDTLNAQMQIDEVIEQINKTNASPFEKYLMAYNYATSRAYKENNQHKAGSRHLTSIFNSDNIVCVGYAKIMDRICEGIGIKSQSQIVDIVRDGHVSGHQNNIVYLKDEKYGIDGYYYSDACWDSQKMATRKKKSLNYCLIPLDDKDEIKNKKIQICDSFNQTIEDVKLKYFYQGKVDKYQIAREENYLSLKNSNQNEYNAVEESSKKKFLNDEKRKKACENLIKILKKSGIPANAYSVAENNKKDVPKRCDITYILALMMEEPANANEIAYSIQELKEFSCKKTETTEHSKSNNAVQNDVYKYLEDLSKMTSKQEREVEETISSDEEFDAVLNDLSNGDIEIDADILNNIFGKKQKVVQRFNEIPNEWKEVFEYDKKIALAKSESEKINEKLKQLANKKGKQISVSKFKEAYKNSLVKQGVELAAADYEATSIINHSTRAAELRFEETAQNGFRQEALKLRKEQDTQENEGAQKN